MKPYKRMAVALLLMTFLMTGCSKATATVKVAARPNAATVQKEVSAKKSKNAIDYDLTQMGADMVYAYVFQMMNDPKTFEGKRIKISGKLNTVKDKKRYYYCVVKDALGCCQNGIEFVWGDGKHSYPADYPKENKEITVVGTYETYREKGDDSLYCRLKDATLSW